jgi:ABC-type nitrate/sulfonate/bicarbonate transport system substrate-binding protein
MDELGLNVAAYRYEHTAALFDGRVKIEGVSATLHTSELVSDIFYGMTQGQFDIAEYGLSYFLRMWDTEKAPFMALPIFPNRNFRHSAIYVNTKSGIQEPEDLNGKTIGEFALYGHDAGVWPKGILSDEYGFKPDECRWIIGGTDYPIPAFSWIPQPLPEGIDVRHTEGSQTLGAMLETGEIDSLVSVDVPQSVLDGSPNVRRLFPDYESVERDYFRRTGIFPPMHVVAIRKEFVEEPGLVRAIYQAFCAAKDIVAQQYLDGASKQHMDVLTPWFSELFAENRRLMSDDWWPYGVEKNRKAIDTFARYHFEQGLSKNLVSSEDIFVPSLLGS